MSSITLTDISDFKNFIKAAATIVCERFGIRKSTNPPPKKTFWKRHIEIEIAGLRKDLIRPGIWFKGRWKNDKKKNQ